MFPTFLALLATLSYKKPDDAQTARFNAAQTAISDLDDVVYDHFGDGGQLDFKSWEFAVIACGTKLAAVMPAASHPKATAAFDALNKVRMVGNGALGAKMPCGDDIDWAHDLNRALRDLHIAVAVAIHATPGRTLTDMGDVAPKMDPLSNQPLGEQKAAGPIIINNIGA